MPKYYIKSGHIKFIISRGTHTEAIFAALKHYKRKSIIIGPKICISEQGFEDFTKWKCYDTKTFLEQAK